MVWKTIKKPTESEAQSRSRRSIKKDFSPIFSKAKTRTSSDLNISQSCKQTVDKKLTKSQSKAYNFILDQQRMEDDPKAKSHKVKSKS